MIAPMEVQGSFLWLKGYGLSMLCTGYSGETLWWLSDISCFFDYLMKLNACSYPETIISSSPILPFGSCIAASTKHLTSLLFTTASQTVVTEMVTKRMVKKTKSLVSKHRLV